jgi:hypothetical protein
VGATVLPAAAAAAAVGPEDAAVRPTCHGAKSPVFSRVEVNAAGTPLLPVQEQQHSEPASVLHAGHTQSSNTALQKAALVAMWRSSPLSECHEAAIEVGQPVACTLLQLHILAVVPCKQAHAGGHRARMCK